MQYRHLLSLVLFSILGSVSLNAQSVSAALQEERIKSSYILAFARNASSGEVSYWQGQGSLNISQLLDRHKQYIAQNKEAIFKGIIGRSYTDALGYYPTDAEMKYHLQYPRTYTEMMKAHLDYASQNSSVYEQVIRRSYEKVFGRQATKEEVAYWQGQPKYSFAMLFALHLQFAKTQRRTTMVATSALTFVKVSPSIAQEVRSAIGLIGNDAGSIVAAGAGNLVGPDGATMVAAGGGN